MTLVRILTATALLAWSAMPLAAQFPFNPGLPSKVELSDSVQVDEADSATKTHLERVRAFAANEQWDEVIETLCQVMESHGEKMVGLALRPYMQPYLRLPSYGLKHYLSVRDYCQIQLTSLPPKALALYRDRVDSQAKRLCEDGMAGRDEPALRRVVEQYFASAWGDDALLALGELALERGDYGQARSDWQQILAPAYWLQAYASRPDRRPPWLVYPDSNLPEADLLARLALCSILEGAGDQARHELELLRSAHPNVAGKLGGRQVVYADALAELLKAMPAWPTPAPSADWPTFGGSPSRSTVMLGGLDIGSVKWQQDLPKPPTGQTGNGLHFRPGSQKEPLSYFPLVVGKLLLVTSQNQIRAYNAETGKPAWGSDPIIYQDEDSSLERRVGVPGLGTPRFTMTAYGNKLYARLGNPVTSSQAEQALASSTGYLACLDLAAEGKLVWRTAPTDDKWAYEGSPLADGGFVYVGMRRSDVRPQAHVACLDAQTGELKWRRFISSAETLAQGQFDEVTNNLLTLDEGVLYYNTNLGAIAALDARDGHIRWLTAYPRAKSGDLGSVATHFNRDLTPCVYDQGRLFVAPADTPPVVAVDAATGLLLWMADPGDDCPLHLLGVAGGNLWASGKKLWWFPVVGGKRHYFPESAGQVQGLGRGALVDDRVYWPTEKKIYVFDQRTAEESKQQIDLSVRGAVVDKWQGSNLLVAGKHLFLLTNDKIIAFDQRSGVRVAREKTDIKDLP